MQIASSRIPGLQELIQVDPSVRRGREFDIGD
jgi:hypothetical protein